MFALISTWRNFMNIWNIRKVCEEKCARKLAEQVREKDFENFLADFTPGFLEGRGEKRS